MSRLFKYPKPGTWQVFQKLARDLLRRKYEVDFEEFARHGQSQFGTDLRGDIPPRENWNDEMKLLSLDSKAVSKILYIQCKKVDDFTFDELIVDHKKAYELEKMGVEIGGIIWAVTSKRDGNLQLEIDKRRSEIPYYKGILFWDNFDELLELHRDIAARYGYSEEPELLKKLDLMHSDFLSIKEPEFGSSLRLLSIKMNDISELFPGIVDELAELRNLDFTQLRKHFQNHSTEDILLYSGYWYVSGELEKAIDGIKIILERNPDHFQALHDAGVAYIRLGKNEEALGLLQLAYNLNPDNAMLLNHIGLALWNLGRISDAETAFKNALKQEPVFHGAYVNLSILYRRSNQLQSCLDTLEEGLSRYQFNPDILAEFGKLLYDLKEYEEAERFLKIAIVFDCNHYWAHFNLGLVYAANDQLVLSRDEFKRAVELDSSIYDGLNNLAFVSQQLDLRSQALEYFELAAEIEPNNSKALMSAAVACLKLGLISEGMSYSRRACDVDEPDALAMHYHALFLALAGKLDEMKQFLGLKPSEFPKDYEILLAVIIGLTSGGDLKAAMTEEQIRFEEMPKKNLELCIEYVHEALRIYPHDKTLRFLLVRYYTFTENDEKLYEVIQDALAADPTNLEFRTFETSALIRLGRYEDALPLVKELYKEVPEHPTVLANYGSIKRKGGEYELAEKYLRAALEKNPQDEFAKRELRLLDNLEPKT